MPYKNAEDRRAYERARYWRNRDRRAEDVLRWQKNNVEYFLYYSAKRRAKRDGVEFSITRSDIPPVPATCPVLGIPLFRKPGSKGPCENSPTLDKIDNTKGYVPGNIAIISFRANRLKADMSLDELSRIQDYIRKAHR